MPGSLQHSVRWRAKIQRTAGLHENFYPLLGYCGKLRLKKGLQELFVGTWHCHSTWGWHISSLLNHAFLTNAYGTSVRKYFAVLIKVFLACEIMCWCVLMNHFVLNLSPSYFSGRLFKVKTRNFDSGWISAFFFHSTLVLAQVPYFFFSSKCLIYTFKVNNHCFIQLKWKHYDIIPLWQA